ncbi:MAG: hypothetical protein ACRD8O_10565, partial [Bryobacteraceae bacterium]
PEAVAIPADIWTGGLHPRPWVHGPFISFGRREASLLSANWGDSRPQWRDTAPELPARNVSTADAIPCSLQPSAPVQTEPRPYQQHFHPTLALRLRRVRRDDRRARFESGGLFRLLPPGNSQLSSPVGRVSAALGSPRLECSSVVLQPPRAQQQNSRRVIPRVGGRPAIQLGPHDFPYLPALAPVACQFPSASQPEVVF